MRAFSQLLFSEAQWLPLNGLRSFLQAKFSLESRDQLTIFNST